MTVTRTLAIAGLALIVGASPALAAERSPAAEDANRKLVVDFYETFFNRHDVDMAAEAIADNYIQHNPYVADGKAPFVDFFRKVFKDNPASGARIIRSATDGDLVFLHVHSRRTPDDRGTAGVDIFRVRDGRIVEHWDVNQKVPESPANTNTMF